MLIILNELLLNWLPSTHLYFLDDYDYFDKMIIVLPFVYSQSELENLSFMYTNAQDYAKIKRRAAELLKEHEKELVEVHSLSLSFWTGFHVGMKSSCNILKYLSLKMVHVV